MKELIEDYRFTQDDWKEELVDLLAEKQGELDDLYDNISIKDFFAKDFPLAYIDHILKIADSTLSRFLEDNFEKVVEERKALKCSLRCLRASVCDIQLDIEYGYSKRDNTFYIWILQAGESSSSMEKTGIDATCFRDIPELQRFDIQNGTEEDLIEIRNIIDKAIAEFKKVWSMCRAHLLTIVTQLKNQVDPAVEDNFINFDDLDENYSSRKKFSLLEFLRSQVIDEDNTSSSQSLENACRRIWDKVWYAQSSFHSSFHIDVSPVFYDQDIPLPLINSKTFLEKFTKRFIKNFRAKNFRLKSAYEKVFRCDIYLADFPVIIQIYYFSSHTSDNFVFDTTLKKDFRSDSSLLNSFKKIILDVFGEIPQSINSEQQQKLEDRIIEEWKKIKKQLVDFNVEKQVKEIVQEMTNSDLTSKLISLDDLDESRLPNQKYTRDICAKFFHNYIKTKGHQPLDEYRINEDHFLAKANLPLASYKEVIDKIISAYENNFEIEILDSYSSHSLYSVRLQINEFDIPLTVDLRYYLTNPDTLFINTFLDTSFDAQTTIRTSMPYDAIKPFKLIIAKILNCDISDIPEFVSTEDANKIYDAIRDNFEKVKRALDRFDLRKQIENVIDSFMNDSQLISFDDLSEE